MHLLVSELRRLQNARCNSKSLVEFFTITIWCLISGLHVTQCDVLNTECQIKAMAVNGIPRADLVYILVF